MKILIGILFSILACFPASASQDLRTHLAFDTGVFLCNGTTGVKYWTNNLGRDIYIRQAHAFMGMSITGKGDFWTTVRRASDAAVLAFTNWDHYAEPTGLHNLSMVFEPNYFLLPAGAQLSLEHGCLTPAPQKSAQVVVYIWWTEAP